MPADATTAAARARALHADALVWDAHSCLPLKPDADFDDLLRHRASGVDYVSINVGMDMNPVADVIRVIAGFRASLAARPVDFVLAGTVAELRQAKRDGRLAVSFDLEGSLPLAGDLAMVGLYRELGVRQMHLVYNRNNAVGGGCHDLDLGLTGYGRQVVAEINRVGILMDCSHAGERTSLEIMEVSTKPVVFSHANPRALVEHGRNISDAQIDACAASGGVIGINGVGLFLGDPAAGTPAILRHLDYVLQRVGPGHVGIGLDYSFGAVGEDVPDGGDAAYWWPPEAGYDFATVRFAEPEQFPEITEGLLTLGLDEGEIRGVLGENFARVAEATWV